jgi:hypothetical protein
MTQFGTTSIHVNGQLNVGHGKTSPPGILNAVASVPSVIGFSAAGWSAPSNSTLSGTDAIHATGGIPSNAISTASGGIGLVAAGGSGNTYGAGGAGAVITGGDGGKDPASTPPAGPGIVANGGASGFDCCAGDGVIANGGSWEGIGVVATGGDGRSAENGFPGVMGIGGKGGGAFDGPGLVGKGGGGDTNYGGDGIDAIAGIGCASGCSNGLAGHFTGDVAISGNLSVGGTKNFKIDHPLDPANKYLYHAALESSEVLDLYSGNAALDDNGEATVRLPEWFEALNRDFRYQLTAIGAAAPNLHLSQEIQNHSFKIAGGVAGMKVSWQITAVRQDAWEKAHPMFVEVEKLPRERGYYINPELYGVPQERNMDWARNPQLMKRIKGMQVKSANQKKAAASRIAKAAQ